MVARIDEGIRSVDYALVILSKAFFAKSWPQRELDAALLREGESRRAFVLPAALDIGAKDIQKFSPILADKRYLDFAKSYDDALKN